MAIDIKTLGLSVDTSGIERGLSKLDGLVTAAGRAENAIVQLQQTSREATAAITEVGESAESTADQLSAAEAATQAMAESEEQATRRIREMVRVSLERQQAMLAAAAATRTASQATRELVQTERAGRTDTLGSSFAQTQQELEALSDAMAHQAQSLDDIAERREWVTELYERGLISLEDSTAHMKTLDRQEKELTRSIEEHAREVEQLLRTYDPASAALAKIAEDEKRLAEALRTGAISAQQHAKASAGLIVSRAKWQAEAEGIKEAATQINLLALSSTQAFRDYATLVGAISRGDLTLASNQILQLGARTGALRALLSPTVAGLAGLAAAAGALAAAFHQGQRESYELHKNLILTGNAAGVTAGHLGEIAQRLDEIGGTRNAAITTLGQLAATGRVGADDLERFAEAVQIISRNTGQTREEIVRTFEDLGRAPVDASIRLNEQMHHLTEEIYDQIVALQQRGEFEEAGALAQRAYADAAVDAARRVGAQLPLLDRAAKATASAFSEMWDAVRGIGRPDTLEDELARLRERRGDRPLFGGRAQFDVALFNADTREEALARRIEEQRAQAAEEGRRKRELQEQIRTQAETAARIQAQQAIANAESSARAAAIQRELNNNLAQYSAYEGELEALRAAGLISETDYYNEKRRLIEQNRDANIEALQLENQRLAAESARARSVAETLKGTAKTPAEVAQLEAQAQAQIIANQTRIAENEARIANLRGDAISQINILNTQQQAANESLARSYDNARAAAQAYLDVLTQQQERELDAFGEGTRARERSATRSQIEDRFAQQRLQLESDRRTGPQTEEAQKRYEQELALLEEFRAKALRADEQYWSRRSELESNFWLGAHAAMQNYIDQASNVAAQSERVFTNAFEAMTDALAQFAATGKLDFKSLANAIIADLLRIQIRAALAGIFGNVLGGLFGSAMGAVGGTGAGGGTLPSGNVMVADTGIMRVPRDNQPMILHKDEAVLPRSLNPWAGGRSPFGGPQVTVNTTLHADSGTNVAQIQALLDERDARLRTEIFENLYRDRWAVAKA